MRETHPIDNLFRDALENASATPPAHVGEAVLAAVRAKRRMAMWRWWSLALLLLFIGAGSAWVTLSEDAHLSEKEHPGPGRAGEKQGPMTQNREYTAAVVPSQATAEQASPRDRAPKSRSVEQGAPAGGSSGAEVASHHAAPRSSKHRASSGAPLNSANDLGAQIPVSTTTGRHWGSSKEESKDSPVPTPTPASPGPTELIFATREEIHLGLLQAVPLRREVSAQVETAALHDGPLLPAGSWWVAPSVGVYASRYSWSGGNSELTSTLGRSHGWSEDLAVGLFGGRTWRSGFVLSVGAEWQRTQELFRSTERVSSVQNTGVDLVTLNTFVISADTTWSVVQEEHTMEGTDRRSSLRIPLELAWHRDIRRWSFGPRIGLAGEFTSVHASQSLTWSQQEGRIRLMELDAAAMRQRYPFAVLGTLGVDAGFLMHEHWSMFLTPSYLFPLFDLGRASETHASAEHMGLRLQLRHTF